MKNKLFNLKRFYNLIRADFIMNYKRYGLGILGMGTTFYLLLLWSMSQDYYSGYQYGPFFICWFFAAIFLISGYSFPEFNNKIHTSNYLLLPSSTLEKFLHQFLVRGIAIIAVFGLIFWIDAHLARITSLKIFHKTSIDIFKYGELRNLIHYQNAFLWNKLATVTGILSVTSFLFAMRLFFGRLAVMKIVITFIVVIFFCTCIAVILSHIIYPLYTHRFEIALRTYEISENFKNIDLYQNCVAYVSWIFFLAIGYFKLKEKQA